MVPRLFAPLRRFLEARVGAVAITFAIALLPILIGIGAAIDLSIQRNLQDRALSAADAAALAVLATDLLGAEANAEAQRIFVANLSSEDAARLRTTKVNVTITTDKSAKSVVLGFAGRVSTSIMNLVGIETLPIGGEVEATVGLKKHIDLHILLDTSDSMGLAADAASRDKLRALTTAAHKTGDLTRQGTNCEFACHRRTGKKSTLEVARADDVTLRIDVARNGINRLADLAIAAKADWNMSRIAIDAFSSSLVPLLGRTADLTKVKPVADSVEIGIGAIRHPNGCWSGFANTWFNKIAPDYARVIRSRIATAVSAETDMNYPDQVVVLITDGLHSQNCAASKGKEQSSRFPRGPVPSSRRRAPSWRSSTPSISPRPAAPTRRTPSMPWRRRSTSPIATRGRSRESRTIYATAQRRASSPWATTRTRSRRPSASSSTGCAWPTTWCARPRDFSPAGRRA